MVPSAEEDQYDVSVDEDDILDNIDCNDKDKEEDIAHHHNANNTVDDNNTTEENRNESSASTALADVGTMNRHAVYNEPGTHKCALHLDDSDEDFGISTLLRSLMDLYNIRTADNSLLSTRNRTSLSDLASLIILHSSTAHTARSQYRSMAQRQGAAHATIPVQTQAGRN
ncbi:hypothetical protein INT45_012395 [Circinella minor]|uniref:Uncharacterized protein n=1 Tax=Circinella minor TaxID=1195481 RepID=A0A8H7VNL6_9FUNG|nr:hypothetical protein INT45_012395 [Circinella minor]